MNEPAVLEKLNVVLALQYRSTLQYAMSSGTIFGLEHQSLGERLWAYAQAELEDTRLIVEKIAALGGDPTTDSRPLQWSGNAQEVVEWLIETETEAIEALQQAIEPTGREGRSEALEHRLEHMIMRKQEQVDQLMRARRSA